MGLPPQARDTAMVSPMAREMANRKEATTPDRAAGKTTLTEVSNLLAPRAMAPSRRERGTARSASSLKEAIMGIIMMATTKPPDSILLLLSMPGIPGIRKYVSVKGMGMVKPSAKRGVTTVMAK